MTPTSSRRVLLHPAAVCALALRAVPALLFALLAAMPSAALADDLYSAIAFSESTGKFGLTSDEASRDLAETKALNNCLIAAGPDCRVRVYSKHCVALVLVIGSHPVISSASSGATKVMALGRAVDKLRTMTSEPGYVLTAFCNRADGEQ